MDLEAAARAVTLPTAPSMLDDAWVPSLLPTEDDGRAGRSMSGRTPTAAGS
jgi:hypothetical protein